LGNSTSVALLASELYSTHGGVQAYMRRLAEILSEYNKRLGSVLDCVSLMDTTPAYDRHARPVTFGNFSGSRRSKSRFTIMAARLAYRHSPRCLVVGHPGLAPVAWLLKKAGLTQNYIVVLHGVEAWRRLNWLDRMAMRDARAIVSTTHYTASEFSALNNTSPDKTRIIPLAIAEGRVEGAGASAPREDGTLRVLTVSRLELIDGYKGVDTLIDAVAAARERNVSIELKIVGSGDELASLQRRAADLNLNGSVIFTGAVSDKDLGRLYRECDVFALPSKGEGFGIVFLEAMYYGKPCIGGNHGGTPEVIEPGRTGFLVNHGDVATLAGHLVNLGQSPSLRLQMGENALRVVRSKYLFPRMQAEWFSVLDEQ
jgi:glycosyltransferase involved in cell wall biosynthesis